MVRLERVYVIRYQLFLSGRMVVEETDVNLGWSHITLFKSYQTFKKEKKRSYLSFGLVLNF